MRSDLSRQTARGDVSRGEPIQSSLIALRLAR
jgi:hypothetical protein